MKEANQLLANQIFMEKGKILNGVKDGGVGEDGSIERMDGKDG